MKRWAGFVVLLYAAMLLLLTMPLVLAYGFEYNHKSHTWSNDSGLDEVVEVVRHWGYWLWLVVMIGSQALLLLVPVAVHERRPVGRRKLLVPALTAAFLMGNVALAGAFSLCILIFGEGSLEVIGKAAEASRSMATQVPLFAKSLAALGFSPNTALFAFGMVAGFVLICWMVWALVFFRLLRHDDATSMTARLTRWLLRGSILELLVAVPSHVVARHRGECCAPAATFWGITCGLTVMLISFGPGVFFLFVARLRSLQPAAKRMGNAKPVGSDSRPPPMS